MPRLDLITLDHALSPLASEALGAVRHRDGQLSPDSSIAHLQTAFKIGLRARISECGVSNAAPPAAENARMPAADVARASCDNSLGVVGVFGKSALVCGGDTTMGDEAMGTPSAEPGW